MSVATGWLGAAAGAVRGARPPFALCYHGLGDAGPGTDPHGLLLPVDSFAEHVDVLERRGDRLVGVEALTEAVRADPQVTGVGALTFDDGLADTLRHALDVVGRRAITITAYIPTGLLGRPHPHLDSGERIVDATELVGLADAGIEIGAHSVDHADLATLEPDAALDQLRRSRATLEDLLGRPVRSMAYPFGSFHAGTMAAAEEAGYTSACACSGPGPWTPLALPREPVFPSTSARRLRLKVAGLYGPVHAVRARRARGASSPR